MFEMLTFWYTFYWFSQAGFETENPKKWGSVSPTKDSKFYSFFNSKV